MFHNLIDSDADMSAFKRRTSFFLATVVVYLIVLFAAAIVGIYTYDARVEAQTNDLLVDYWVPPVKPPVTPNRSQPPRRTPPSNNRVSERPTRPILYESASNPITPPSTISAAQNLIPPAPPNAIEAPYVSDPPPTNPSNSGCEG